MVEEVRVVSLAFPVGLLRKIDELVQHGAGGYETRTEFVIDSVRQNIEVMQAEDRGGGPPRNDRCADCTCAPGPTAHATGDESARARHWLRRVVPRNCDSRRGRQRPA